MRFILDTHVFLWFVLGNSQLSPTAFQSDTPGKAGGLMNVTASKADAPPKVSDCESFSDCIA
jgi:hypothetical protein